MVTAVGHGLKHLSADLLNSSFPTISPNNATNSTVEPMSWTKRHMIGMSLALAGNLLISISLSVQKKAHNRLGQDSGLSYCLDRWWWLGMFLMVAGELGNFMAYGYAPASLVAPLGSVAVLSNALIAVVILREPLVLPSIMGVTLVIVGSIILVSFSVKGRPVLTSEEIVLYLQAWPFLLYMGLEIVGFAILLYLKYIKGNEHMIVLLLLVGVIASVTIIAAKALSTMISESIFLGKQEFMNPVFWACIIILPITTATQIRYLNRAMQLYDVSDVVPVNFIFFTVSAILAGAMFYQEFNGVGFDRIFMFVFGCILSFIGVYVIAHQGEYRLEEYRKRGMTADSGLMTGTSGFSEHSSSFNTEGISVSDTEDLAVQSSTTSPPVAGGTETTGLMTGNKPSNGPKNTETCQNVLTDLVSILKSTEKIEQVQPKVTEFRES